MTVAELIAELQKHPPQLPVKVLLGEVVLFDEQQGEWSQDLSEEDAAEARDVSRRGGYILVEG